MYNIIITALLISAFFMCITSYILGLKHGKLLGNNQIPNIEINPVKKVVEAVEQHKAKKEEEKLTDELQIMMNITKESMLNAVKKER